MRTVVILCLAILATCQLVSAGTIEVPRDHWSYQAIANLSQKGLVLGYADANIVGNKTLTRYEMASLVKRAVDTSVMVQSQDAKTSTSNAVLTQDDVNTISKLVAEYKPELSIIGADLSAYNERLERLESDVCVIKEGMSDPEGSIQTTVSDVKKLKKIKLSGYLQARYEYIQGADAGNSKDTFMVRRARIKLEGRPTDRTNVVIQGDYAGNVKSATYIDSVNFPNQTTTSKTLTVDNSVTTKTAFLEYLFTGDYTTGPYLTFGQFEWPFGYQVIQSSAVRETPEQALVIRSLFPGEVDRGIKISSAKGQKWFAETGVFNGTGQNNLDNNKTKDFVGRARYFLLDNLEAGASFYTGNSFAAASGTTPATEFTKNRYGADFQYYMTNASIKGEYVHAKDLGFTKSGYYLLGSYNVTKDNQLVLMYDVYNDPSASAKKFTNYNIGINHWLDEATKLRLFYEIDKEESHSTDNNILRFEILSIF